ncbi:acyltransferase [Flavobacterium xanthum]|uniref:Transferase hexapeptide (Six repeat-containing protein) n=1 Tax=Flavobacterium xanthum TaxID=69322 RepID=A0A1M6YBS2_9FLAO|nr:hypothetical protein [Flavobacterium xanthum]SHL15721.1 hypothetical protein SAMN05443669_100319 [Flavobacterium xanthum]
MSIALGSHIGEGSIVAMGCVVSGKIPALSIIAGNPCKVISQRDKNNYEENKKKGAIYLKAKKQGLISPEYHHGFSDKNT